MGGFFGVAAKEDCVFDLFFGIFDYEEDYRMYYEKHPLIPYIWLAFYIIFHLVLCSVFFCIIKSWN